MLNVSGAGTDLRMPDRVTSAALEYQPGSAGASALQFALYAYAVRGEFPSSAPGVLRSGADGASFEINVPAMEEQLRYAGEAEDYGKLRAASLSVMYVLTAFAQRLRHCPKMKRANAQ